MPPLSLPCPSLVLRATYPPTPLSTLSTPLLSPLWSLPYPEQPDRSTTHRAFVLQASSPQLLSSFPPIHLSTHSSLLDDPAVAAHLSSLSSILTKEREKQHRLMGEINGRRCGNLFFVSGGGGDREGGGDRGDRGGGRGGGGGGIWGLGPLTRQALSIGLSPTHQAVLARSNPTLRLSTPLSLLHLIKEEKERAEEALPLIEKFTCVIPKVRSSWPILVSQVGRVSLPPTHPPIRNIYQLTHPPNAGGGGSTPRVGFGQGGTGGTYPPINFIQSINEPNLLYSPTNQPTTQPPTFLLLGSH